MMLKEGQVIKLENYQGHGRIEKTFRGTVGKVYRNYILLDLENYKTSITLADILDPADYVLRVKIDGIWRKADKSMLDRSLFSDDNIRRPRL